MPTQKYVAERGFLPPKWWHVDIQEKVANIRATSATKARSHGDDCSFNAGGCGCLTFCIGEIGCPPPHSMVRIAYWICKDEPATGLLLAGTSPRMQCWRHGGDCGFNAGGCGGPPFCVGVGELGCQPPHSMVGIAYWVCEGELATGLLLAGTSLRMQCWLWISALSPSYLNLVDCCVILVSIGAIFP